MRRQAARIAVALIVGITASIVPGCRDGATEALDEQSPKGFIAFVGAGPDDAVWPVLKAGAERYAASGTALGVRFFLPASSAPAAQADLLKDFWDPDLRGLCIQISDLEVTAPALRQLQKRGVEIVTMAEPAPAQAGIAHVGLDEAAVGKELARCTGESLRDRPATVMVLHAGIKHPLYSVRYLSFSDQIKLEEGITVLREFNCQADPSEARRIIREVSARYPRLTAWIAIQDWPLADGYPAEKLFPPGIQYITFGGLPRHWPLIQSGLSPCVLGADYSAIGGRALQLCQSAIRSPAEHSPTFHIALRPVTPATLEQYRADWSQWVRAAETPPTTNASAADP